MLPSLGDVLKSTQRSHQGVHVCKFQKAQKIPWYLRALVIEPHSCLQLLWQLNGQDCKGHTLTHQDFVSNDMSTNSATSEELDWVCS